MNKISKGENMKTDSDVILEMLDSYITSASIGAAMELGLFWHLDQKTLSGQEIAEILNLPTKRCHYWLQYLCKVDLLEQAPDGFSLTKKTQSAIVDTYSKETWALLAKESREWYPVFQYLASNLHEKGSLWKHTGSNPPNYIDQMSEDPERARQFTRMLYELHHQLAEEIAKILEMDQTNLLMDLGGGSGVVSMALLRRHPQLNALVVDIPNVCKAGFELAVENSIDDRLKYHPADFINDELPKGFDMVLECDVGVYDEDLFTKIRRSLTQKGRYVIVDQFSVETGEAPLARLSWALQGSLQDPDFSYLTVDEIISMLEQSGFQRVTSQELPKFDSRTTTLTNDMYIITAHA
jgi:predicted TPR repeat methyltransferase